MTRTTPPGLLAAERRSLAHLVPTPVRVVRRRRESHDVFTLEIDASSLDVDALAPGRFHMLYAFGVGEVPISISGNIERPERLSHTIRGVGAVTRALVALGAGDTLGLRGPYGVGWPLADIGDRDVVVIAGGLGLAPLKPAIEALTRERGRNRRVTVLVGARTPDDLLFAREFARWTRALGARVHVTVDRAPSDWGRHVGVVPALIDLVDLDPRRTVALVCGPEVMMRFTVRKLLAKSFAPADVWVSMERSMRCAVGFCGHCQLGPSFVCKDGPVFRYDRVGWLVEKREV
jgi:NAD(P)H-flavin reductase